MINLPRGPSLSRFLISASAALAISALAAPGGGTTPARYDPTRPLGDTSRYTQAYSTTNIANPAGSAWLQINSFYEGVAEWDEYDKQTQFPVFSSAVGGTETAIAGTLTLRVMRGYGPTPDTYAAGNTWADMTYKGQTEFTISAADFPAILTDKMFTQAAPLPKGMHKFLRVWVITSDGMIPLCNGIRGGVLEGCDATAASNATSNYWNVTTWRNRGRVNATGIVYGPCASFSRGPAGRVSLASIGDSNLYGDAGTNQNSFVDGVRGPARRAFNQMPVGRRVVTTDISIPGANPGCYVRNPDGTRGEDPARFAGKIGCLKPYPEPTMTRIYNQHEINAGFGNLNTLYSDNMMEYFLKIRSLFPGIPIDAATAPTHLGGGSCTDGFETQAGIPNTPSFRPGGTFFEYHEALKAGKFAGIVDKIIDCAAAFNGSAGDPLNPDPYKSRAYSGGPVDTVAANSTDANKITVSNPDVWEQGMSLMVDPAGLSKAGRPVGIVNAKSGNVLSLGGGNTTGAVAGMKIRGSYFAGDVLHFTKEGQDLFIPAILAYGTSLMA